MSPAPKKKDPSITFLNKFGYNVIRLPRTGIEPLDVIGRQGPSMQLLGPIRAIWTGGNPEPRPGPPDPTVAVNGERTGGLDLSFGLSILGGTLRAFGISAPSLDTAFKNAHSVQFTYSNVTSTSVTPFAAGDYLSKGTLNSENAVMNSYLGDDKAKTYLILDVLKSDSITVTATDSHGAEVSIDIPHIEGIADAKIGVKPSGSSNSTITFTGPVAVTFGFAVMEIAWQGNKWVVTSAPASGALSFGAPGFGTDTEDEEQPNPMVFDTGEFDCRVDLKVPD